MTCIFFGLTVLNIGVQSEENVDGTTTYSSNLPILWVVSLVILFFILYKTDSKRKSRTNLGFAYHLATGAVVLVTILSLTLIGLLNSNGLDYYLLIPAIAWGISLLIHWVATRTSIKGIEGKKVFK